MGGAVFGVVAEQLGRLAAYLGQPDEAARYLATARDRYERAGAPALRARLDALAVSQPQAAASRPADGVGLLRRSGQVWLAECGDEIERFFAAASAIWCLPQGRVGPDPEPVGTLIRPAAMLGLARRAGYADGQILPIEHPVWRFYRLVP